MAMDWLPGATRSPMHEGGFDWQVACPTKGVLHTTESMSWPDYPSQHEPHLTVLPHPRNGVEVRQHVALTKAAYALKHPAGTVATNGAHAIQMELVGTCDPNGPHGAYYWPMADDTVLRDLYGKVIKPISEAFHIPLTALAFKAYPASYGPNGVRLGERAWLDYSGWLGHEHVPGNDHGDPGAFPWARLVQHATPPPRPLPVGTIIGPLRYGSTGDSVKVVQKFLGVTPDGIFGRRTLIAVENWQSRRHLGVDGVVGPDTARRMGFDYRTA